MNLGDKEISLILLCGIVVICGLSYFQRTRFIEEIDSVYRIIVMSIVLGFFMIISIPLLKNIFPPKEKKEIA